MSKRKREETQADAGSSAQENPRSTRRNIPPICEQRRDEILRMGVKASIALFPQYDYAQFLKFLWALPRQTELLCCVEKALSIRNDPTQLVSKERRRDVMEKVIAAHHFFRQGPISSDVTGLVYAIVQDFFYKPYRDRNLRPRALTYVEDIFHNLCRALLREAPALSLGVSEERIDGVVDVAEDECTATHPQTGEKLTVDLREERMFTIQTSYLYTDRELLARTLTPAGLQCVRTIWTNVAGMRWARLDIPIRPLSMKAFCAQYRKEYETRVLELALCWLFCPLLDDLKRIVLSY